MELEPSFTIVDENVPNAIKEPALVTKASKKVAKAGTTTDSKFNAAIPWKDPQIKKSFVLLDLSSAIEPTCLQLQVMPRSLMP